MRIDGGTGFLTLDLLERQGVLAPGGFVGIDLDPVRIAELRQSRPDLKWVAGNPHERLEAPELANVGILNLDEYGAVGKRSARVDFDLICGPVERGLDTFGEFALFWNQDLDVVARRRQGRGQALRRHANMVCETLGSCLPRRELTSEKLLPKGSEAEIDSGFVGVLGAFEVYCGTARGHRVVQSEVARGRVDARTCRCATPTDQEFERAQDHLLGLVQIRVTLFLDADRMIVT